MKLTAIFLALWLPLLSNSAAAFIVNSLAINVTKPAVPLTHAMEARAEAVAKPLLSYFIPLKFILTSMGIPIEQLLKASKKCLDELGPEAVETMIALKGALTVFG
ncbi:secretoglobin family 3A member 1 [Elephas maximus indicus]|uniref:Secretoglobin family 3A member 1 n=1 Tax=Loxodonta africana TaxID=9785 RepID=G3T4N5_LOXAF|nr:secretoglobin family 3A member 1 [Elephas maximus indicus]